VIITGDGVYICDITAFVLVRYRIAAIGLIPSLDKKSWTWS